MALAFMVAVGGGSGSGGLYDLQLEWSSKHYFHQENMSM